MVECLKLRFIGQFRKKIYRKNLNFELNVYSGLLLGKIVTLSYIFRRVKEVREIKT